MDDDTALIVYLVALWIATLGITAPRSSKSIVCVRAKQLAGVTFVVLVVDMGVRMNGAR
jgi:hypothetical protein